MPRFNFSIAASDGAARSGMIAIEGGYRFYSYGDASLLLPGSR